MLLTRHLINVKVTIKLLLCLILSIMFYKTEKGLSVKVEIIVSGRYYFRRLILPVVLKIEETCFLTCNSDIPIDGGKASLLVDKIIKAIS